MWPPRGLARILVNGVIRSTNDSEIRIFGTKPGGSVEFTRANTFTGEVRIERDALLRVTNKDPPGSTAARTIVADGTLEFALSQSATVTEPLALKGGSLRLVPGGAAQPILTFPGDMDVNPDPNVSGDRMIDLGLPAVFTSALDGDVIVNGSCRSLTLGGAAANHLRLTTDAELTLAQPPGVPAVRALALSAGATAHWNADMQLGEPVSTFAKSLTLTNATAELGSPSETVDSLVLENASTVRVDSGGVLRVFSLRALGANIESRIEGAGAVGSRSPVPASSWSLPAAWSRAASSLPERTRAWSWTARCGPPTGSSSTECAPTRLAPGTARPQVSSSSRRRNPASRARARNCVSKLWSSEISASMIDRWF